MNKFVIYILSFSVLTLASCKKEKEISAYDVMGDWKVQETRIIYPDGTELLDENNNNGLYSFSDDGIGGYYSPGSNVPYTFTWYLSSNHDKLTVSYDEVSTSAVSFSISLPEVDHMILAAKIPGPQAGQTSTQRLELFKI